MKPYFNTFIEKIPEHIHLKTQSYMSENICIFEPQEYVINQKIYVDEYHFVMFYSAPPLIRIGRSEYQFQKGSLLSIEPGMDLTVLPFNSGPKAEFVSICINKQFFQRAALEAAGKEEVRFKRIENIYSRQLLNAVDNFKYELLNYGDNHPRMIQSIATQIAFQLLRDVDTNNLVQRRKSNNDRNYINNAIEYMQSNYNCNITIDEISREIYVSPAHFERMFKYYTGRTPHQYLLAIRIEKAKEMLKKDEYSIEEAARLCGFINLGHFSTVFKRIVGITPSEYRKNIY